MANLCKVFKMVEEYFEFVIHSEYFLDVRLLLTFYFLFQYSCNYMCEHFQTNKLGC
jgi:hypothetical protein